MKYADVLDKTTPATTTVSKRAGVSDLPAAGEPFLWGMGGALVVGLMMIAGFLVLVFWNGITTFIPKPIEVVTLASGEVVAGEPYRSESYRVGSDKIKGLGPDIQKKIAANDGFAMRTLYRTGNYDLYGDDFRWVSDYEITKAARPVEMVFIERLEWGAFIGSITSLSVDGKNIPADQLSPQQLTQFLEDARGRWNKIRRIERIEIGNINHEIEGERLRLKRVAIDKGVDSPAFKAVEAEVEAGSAALQHAYEKLAAEATETRTADANFTITLREIGGREKTLRLSEIVRLYHANDLGTVEWLGIYLSRWAEFLTDEPREANTEGGVLPAIFGTFAMTVLMAVLVAPFGVVTALYLREYAKQGRLVSIVRISVNNLAGVPSIVYGVFGLGFFAYIMGASIDQLFYPERLPNPTFGTGGLLWSSLTLALLTVPVVIVATEEAISAVPRSMREGSLACGASKWQTIRNIVLPRAMPGILTGLILAMARGAGEVAPLMLVGVVKLAPELPIDGYFPFIHLERSFMHLGFHIYDVGFQSRNSEAGKPMVFVTTLLLIGLIFVMNITAIVVRNRLKQRFAGSKF
ncbi:phosphate ABC transporter permease PstA [Magnetospirillum sp. 64-120]|uniref:phosphate ABC transporter permease PstA n=1 Tax=Magnetospirillum sp. 64-120 TaxID=1895778 RepID=UPI000A75CB42|nr:phosphate ABC transporter permease PstA [Magnetospirillum sp. 64-120]